MNVFKDKRKRRALIWIGGSLLVILLLVGVFFIYVGDYYRADTDAIEAFCDTTPTSVREEKISGALVYSAEHGGCDKGFIFYPGGKVEYTAYEPLMRELASHGVLCVLMKMPFNLAVFDINAADGIKEKFPAVTEWYIGGHSLGGSMAASYLEKHSGTFSGLVLLASYSAANLNKGELSVLSIYGSEDKVLNRKKYESNKKNLPEDLLEIVIEGGNHAFFGTYGQQKGDGEANISNAEQIKKTAEEMARYFYR